MNSNYTIKLGYVHWRKSRYEDEGVLDVGALHADQLNALPTMPLLDTAGLSEFLTKAAPPQLATTKFSKGDQTKNMRNYTGNIFVADIRAALQKAHSEGLDSRFTWTKHRKFDEASRITGKDIAQLVQEYKEVITFLRKAIQALNKNSGKNTEYINSLTDLKKRYEGNSRLLKKIETQLSQNRGEYLPNSWLSKETVNQIGTKSIEEVVNDLENIQILYALPTAAQYAEAQEQVLASIKATRKKYLKTHLENMTRVVKAEKVGRNLQATRMQGLQMVLNKSPFLKLDQLTNEIRSQSDLIGNASVFTTVSDRSGTIITTQPSYQTVDVTMEIEDNRFGTRDLKASVKAYQKTDNIHLVSGAPLTTILELSTNDDFLIHYMNIMSDPQGRTAPSNDGMDDPDDSSAVNDARIEMESYMKRLMAMRALMGVRGRDFSNISNVLLVTEGQTWKAYDTGKIIRSEQILSALKSEGSRGLDPIPMDWVTIRNTEINRKIATFGAAKERVNKLYAQMHALKLNVSMNLNKI